MKTKTTPTNGICPTPALNGLAFKKIAQIVSIFLVFFASYCCYGQQKKIDSLRQIVYGKEMNLTSPKDTSYILTVLDLSRYYYEVRIDSTRILAEYTKRLSEKIGYDKGIVSSIQDIGVYHSYKGNSDAAIACYQEALSASKNLGDKEVLAELFNNFGMEYSFKGDYGLALEANLKGLDHAKESNSLNLVTLINTNIGVLYAKQQLYKEAETYFKNAIVNYKVDFSDYNYIASLLNLARVYSIQGKNKDADDITETLIAKLDTVKDISFLFEAYHIKGFILSQKKEYDNALPWFQKCLDISAKNPDNPSLLAPKVDAEIAKIYFEKDMDEKAFFHANRAYGLARKLNILDNIIEISELLYKLHKRKRNIAGALEYHEIFKVYSDSLFNDRNTNGVILFQARSEFEKKQTAAAMVSERKLMDKQSKINMALLAITVLLIMLVPLGLKHLKLARLNKEIIANSKILKQKEVALTASNATKDRLFSIIGHDLKNPIASLQSMIFLYLDKAIPGEEFLNLVPSLGKDVQAMMATLSNLLQWGKSQIQGAKIVVSKVQVKPIADNTLQFLNVLSNSKELRVDNAIELDFMVLADKSHLDIILRNLLGNAIKFTPPKGSISLSCKREGEQGIIVIKDSGVGMDKATAARVMDINEGYTSYGTENEKGTGLGLSLCIGLLSQNNGKLWVESEQGKGTSFFIALPLA